MDDIDALLEESLQEVTESTQDDILAAALEEVTISSSTNINSRTSKSKNKNKKGKNKSKVKNSNASAAFVSTKKKVAELVLGDSPSFLDESGSEMWQNMIVNTKKSLTEPLKTPFSRAYRSFSVREETVNVLLGSAAEVSNEVEDVSAVKEKKPAMRLYQSTLGNALAAASTVEPSMSISSNVEMKSRLSALYVRQLAIDLKSRVATDPNFESERFPLTASMILTK